MDQPASVESGQSGNINLEWFKHNCWGGIWRILRALIGAGSGGGSFWSFMLKTVESKACQEFWWGMSPYFRIFLNQNSLNIGGAWAPTQMSPLPVYFVQKSCLRKMSTEYFLSEKIIFSLWKFTKIWFLGSWIYLKSLYTDRSMAKKCIHWKIEYV